MQDDLFEQYVSEAVSSLPQEFKEKLSNVSIHIEDFPSPEQIERLRIREGHSYLLGLYEGIPQTARGVHYGVGGAMPDKITIFKYPILSMVKTEGELVEQIKSTVLHEIGHHFGMSEEEIRSAEEDRNQ